MHSIGENNRTEYYSALRAEVEDFEEERDPVSKRRPTSLNYDLIAELKIADK